MVPARATTRPSIAYIRLSIETLDEADKAQNVIDQITSAHRNLAGPGVHRLVGSQHIWVHAPQDLVVHPWASEASRGLWGSAALPAWPGIPSWHACRRQGWDPWVDLPFRQDLEAHHPRSLPTYGGPNTNGGPGPGFQPGPPPGFGGGPPPAAYGPPPTSNSPPQSGNTPGGLHPDRARMMGGR
ncbi:hypothetical protein JB92DRAFT_2831837 [Gautieria morchelliformis]|nr:hypothetical protein JB92DRAFT_2831837 [Gautieria morchelliformis]